MYSQKHVAYFENLTSVHWGNMDTYRILYDVLHNLSFISNRTPCISLLITFCSNNVHVSPEACAKS